ncbi:MAG: hypothetical protein JSW05_04465 [Candidatus Thorarchaeota archaeon]|nr:MAG: hypothetical protein JSW05_04465 [Candidatus Thorarchaeota archaeon]
MDAQDRSYRVLRIVIAFGGLFELVMGLVILFWGDLIISIATGGLTPTYPLYWRTMGLLAVALGSLQVVASQDPRRYVAIPITASSVRFLLPILTYLQVLDTPSMAGMLIVSTVFDFLLAVATAVLLFQAGLLNRNQQ